MYVCELHTDVNNYIVCFLSKLTYGKLLGLQSDND